jgi:hypothetical protein
MKLGVAALLVGGLVAVAIGEDMQHQEQTWALTTIDQLPTKGQLDTVLTDPMQPPPVDQLIAYARNTDGNTNAGVRLRAITALTNYCQPCTADDPVHTTMTDLIAANASAHAGADLLILRAAIEADGPLKVSTDLGILAPLLDHPSRDIRAATAHALAQLRNCQATTALRTRYQNESTDQVKLAISETLRILSQPNYCLVN